MRFTTMTALAALAQHVVAEDWTQKLLFHGTSLILRPDYKGHEAFNHTATAANFYCYFGQTGYISFGWWLPATSDADSGSCHPDNEQFDWFEYTVSEIECTSAKCRAHMVNWDNVPQPEKPSFEEDYVFQTVNSLDDNAGRFHLGFFDREGGALAVGTARALSFADKTEQECRKALRMLRRVQTTRGIKLPFQLSDICGTASGSSADVGGKYPSAQRPLALPWVG